MVFVQVAYDEYLIRAAIFLGKTVEHVNIFAKIIYGFLAVARGKVAVQYANWIRREVKSGGEDSRIAIISSSCVGIHS